MGKALKTVGVIIGGAALIATGVGALAMPALAGTTTLFGVSVGTLNTISSGLVAVGGMLDKPKSQGSAAPDEWTSNPDQPIPFLMGRMGVAGKIVQRDEFGPDNMYQGIVGIISGAGPIRGVNGFAGDKQPVTFGANGIAVTSQWEGEMWMVRRPGAQPDAALTVPAGLKSGGTAFEWSPAAKLSGKACYLQVLGENSKGTAFPAGVPDPMHVAEGIFGYDPRYDDTYPGGAGPCRLGVRSTYRWIEDGGIGALNWALGLVENGQVVGGIGASLDGIDVPAFVEVANIADANNWKLAAWPDTSEDVSAVLDQLLQAAGAVRARHAGKISCVSRGAPRASVATITARDTAGDIELDTAPSLFNRLNTITPRFMSEEAGWVLTPADPVFFAQYVTDDGGKHSDQIDYRFVSDLKQAAELAAYDILDAREPFSGTIPLKPHMRHLKRGDTFLVSEPGFLMDGVKCIVLSRSYDPKTAQVRIGFRSETDSKHALALGKTTTLPAFPVLTPTDPTFVTPPAPGDWTVTVPGPAPDGSQLPNIDLTGLVSNDTADALLISWRAVTSGENPNTPPLYLDPDGNVLPGWMDAGSYAPTIRSLTIQGPKSGAVVWLALRYRRGSNFSAAELKGPITVRTLVADVMPNAPGLSQIKADLEAAFGEILDVSDLISQTRTELNAVDAALLGAIEDTNTSLGQASATLLAADEALSQAIGAVGDRAQVLEETTASLEENKASVSALNAQIARIDDVEAVNATQSSALVDLEAGKVEVNEYNTLKAEVAAARDGSPSLLGQIQNLKSVDLDLEANKASVSVVEALSARTDGAEAGLIDLSEALASESVARSESINVQSARVDDVEAVNATQALALVDLENGKVALSEYNTLKGEVLSARDGAPSLLGKIQNLKSVDLDLEQNKASVASVEALTARTANTEADIIDLENAAANDRTATAQAISQVSARQNLLPNKIRNGDFRSGLANYIQSGTGWIVGTAGGPGAAYAFCGADGQQDLWTDYYPVDTNLSFAFMGSRSGANVSLNLVIEWWSETAQVGFGTVTIVPQGGFQRIIVENDVRPATATRFRILARKLGTGGNVAFTLLKVNTGAYATPWSDDQDAKAVQASVTEQALAIIDLENQQALASWRVKAEATGGRPTILELLSGSFGSSIAMTAEQIYFGDNTVFDDATDTIQTVWGSTRKVMAWGAPFGPDNLVEWTGPSSIALGSMTKANAGFWVDQVGAYGPTPLPSFWAKVTPTQISRSRTGAGSISTALNDVIVTCYTGTSGATCTWSRVSGDTTISYPSTGFTPVFNTTLAAGQTKTALFVGLVAKGGDVDLVYVNVEFSDNV